MRRRLALLMLLIGLALASGSAVVKGQDSASVRFATVAVVLDPQGSPLAAYQVAFDASPGVTIVGIEGGDGPVFADPPYYDPKAIQHDRAILAAFSLREDAQLPKGPTRVATVHVRLGPSALATPDYKLSLIVAADPQGRAIDATATLAHGDH